jgi:capsular polysaccharide transport system permease protein
MESSITPAGFAGSHAAPQPFLSSNSDLLSPAATPPAEGLAQSLRECFQTQCRVIHALLMREILTRYGRKNIGFLWLFIDPMIFTAIISFIWAVVHAKQFTNISTWAFAVTGYSTAILWRSMANRCLAAVEPNRSLLYHHSVKIFDFYAARIILEAAGATMAFVFIASLFTLFGLMKLPYDPLQVAYGWLLLLWFGAGLALVVGPLTEVSTFAEKIWTPISYLSFMFSGALFFVDMLPPKAQQVILWVPVVSGIEYLREGYFGPVIRFHYDLGYLIMWNLTLSLVGLWQVRLMKRRITFN